MKLESEIFQNDFKNKYVKAAVNLVYTFNWLNKFHVNKFKRYGLTPQQYNILRILRGQHPKPATVKLLKERMLDKMSDASRLVEKLRVKGLVERYICSSDRRNVDVIITEKGLELLKQIDETEHEIKEYMSNLTEEETVLLNELLDKLRG